MNMMMGPGGRTNTAIKFIIVMALGVLPLALCALFITDPEMASQFKQWGQFGKTNASLYMDYGFMWLLGLALYILIFPVIYLLSNLTKEVKLDVIPATSAAGLATLNMFVIPHTHAAFLILSLPSFAIIGYIFGSFIMIISALKKMQRDMKKMQNNPEFQERMKKMQNDPQFQKMMEDFKKQQGINIPKSGEQKDIKDNPYVDIPEEEKEDEEK